jgi:hypothetical protein
MTTFNEPFSRLAMRRRYEVWFLRLGLSDGSGAWWCRYLLTNPGRNGGVGDPQGQPVQVWATWFPREGKAETCIQRFPLKDLRLSQRGTSPVSFDVGENHMGEGECRGRLEVGGHKISWDLRYGSSFRVELSSKGWIGFSRTPHSDAVFSGEITLDGRSFRGEPLGTGMQGHNCGYRHRNFWTWTHALFPGVSGSSSSFEALVYEMPFGLIFRKAVLWHKREKYIFRKMCVAVRDARRLIWELRCDDGRGAQVSLDVRGREGLVHRLPYMKTDCSGHFEVSNDSLAAARLVLQLPGGATEELRTDSGAVLEMAGGEA